MEEQIRLPESQNQSKAKPILLTLLAILLAVAVGVGTYYWQHEKVVAANKKITSLNNLATQQNKLTNTSQNPISNSGQAVHFVESLSGGFKLSGSMNLSQFLTKLGVPSYLQAVKVSSTIQNQGDGFSIFGNGAFGNELGRWELGQPTYDESNSGGTSEISLIALSNDWLSSTSTTDQTLNSMTYNNPLETPAQKQQFLAKLKSTTANCVKNSSTGFTTVDGTLAVCYTFQYPHQAYAAYEPQVILEGYGDIQGQPVILTGFIEIYDSSVASESPAATEQTYQGVLRGKVPPQTAQDQNAIISAVKQTTVTVVPEN